MEKPTTAQLIATFRTKKYLLIETEYYPNLFGIRKENNVPNEFDDFVGAVWKDKSGEWRSSCYAATTDPGTHWLLHPMNVNGTAILVPGQYIKVYKIGKHTGYTAYQQTRPMTYVRDINKNSILDWLYRTVGFKTYKEVAATNLHHANAKTASKVVDKWSAGCQVVANPTEYQSLLELGMNFNLITSSPNEFNYTLFEEKDIIK